MTNPDEPRDRPRGNDRSWADGTANPPPEGAENDQSTEVWQPQPHPGGQQYQQYPDSQPYPTGQPYPGTQPYPTGQPYPDQSTQQFGSPQSPGQEYGQPYPQQPNPTQAMPPYDPNQQYAANQQYASNQQYPANQQYAGNPGQYGPPPGYTGETPVEGGKSSGGGSGGDSSNKWLVALLALAVLVVVVLAGILFLTNRSSDSEVTASPGITRTLPQSSAPLPSTPGRAPVVPSAPGGLVPGGIPEILGGAGAAVGTITAIDGAAISIDGVDGAPLTVTTTPQTEVISLSGFDISDLKVGSLVVVNGAPVEGGSITADVIIEVPKFGG